MIPLIYTFDWFKRDKNFTTSNKEIKLNWERGLNDKFSSFIYKISQVNMLLNKKSELIDELAQIGINFGIKNRRILINDKDDKSMTNNKSIIVSTKFNKNITNLYDRLDLIIGLFCHECSHCLYSDFNYINKGNSIVKWIQNVIEDELIESKLGQTYPGYINFISKTKYYYFDVLKDDILNGNDKNDLDKIMKIFLLIIRYPKYLNEIPERELIEYADLFDKIYDILKSNVCLNPDRNNMCTSLSYNSAKQVYELIRDYINKKYPKKNKNKNNKKNSSKKNNKEKKAEDFLGSDENEENFNDSSDELENSSSDDYEDNSEDNSSDDYEDNDDYDNSDYDNEDYDDEDYDDSEDFNLDDLEDDEENNNTSINSEFEEDNSDEDNESISSENIEGTSEDENDSDIEDEDSSKTSFDKMEEEVNNEDDSVKNLYDKVNENVESSSESKTDTWSSSSDIEEQANKIEEEWKIEERESLNIEIRENELNNEISNYNEIYNEIRPYITFAKQMIIKNQSDDILNIERFRKNGMLDTRKIAEAYMGCNNVFTQNIQKKKKNQNSRYALVIMLDESGSMSYKKIFDFTTQLAILIYETVKMYKNMEIYIYGHGDYVIPYITKNQLNKEILATRHSQGDQDEPTSYRAIIEDVKKQTNLPIIAVNITDSFYCYQPEQIKEVVNEYKKQHVDINLICCSEECTFGSNIWNMNNEIYGVNHWISIDQLGNKFKSSMKILGNIISRNYNS